MGKVFQVDGRIPQAAVAVVGKLDNQIAVRVEEEYKKAVSWYKNNPQEAGFLVKEYIDFFSPKAVSLSIPNVQIEAVSAMDAKEDLEKFFQILLENEPKLLGGKIPDEGLYFK